LAEVYRVADVLELTYEAGQAILKVYLDDNIAVSSKPDLSPVTRADKLANELLMKGLERIGNAPVLSEEAEIPSWTKRREWREYWLIDPLDGTREFIKRNGEFTVNIAYISDGRPVLGVVYAPVTDLFYYGVVGEGAYRQKGLAGRPQPIQCSKPPPHSRRPWRVLGSRSHSSPQFDAFLSRLPAYELTQIGSSLKLCLIAEGVADLYPRFGPTSEWDTAAGQAVVEAAGGLVLEWQSFTPLRYNTKESLLNPSFVVCSQISSTWTH